MPVQTGRDSQGPFKRWGKNGKKYHYQSGDKESRDDAHNKAAEQGRAIKSSQNKED